VPLQSEPLPRVRRLDFIRGRVGEGGEIAGGDAAEFGADDIGGEAGAKKRAVEGSELALIERAADMREAALEARADERGFVRFGEDGVERGFDVAVGNAAGAQFARDAKTPLAARLRVRASVVEGVAGVVEIVVLAQPGDDGRNEFGIFGAAAEVFAHFMDGVRAAHERAQGGGVKLLLGGEFARG
jgi:hypothetical protein